MFGEEATVVTFLREPGNRTESFRGHIMGMTKADKEKASGGGQRIE